MDERVCRCEAMAANMRKDMVGRSEEHTSELQSQS